MTSIEDVRLEYPLLTPAWRRLGGRLNPYALTLVARLIRDGRAGLKPFGVPVQVWRERIEHIRTHHRRGDPRGSECLSILDPCPGGMWRVTAKEETQGDLQAEGCPHVDDCPADEGAGAAAGMGHDHNRL